MSAIVKSNGGGAGAPLAVSGSVRLDGMADVLRLSEMLARAQGFVPRAFLGQPAAISAAILTGLEMGMGPMESLRSIHMVEGKPTLSADLMLARAIRAGVLIEWARSDNEAATIVLERGGKRHTQTFTMDDARTAELAGKGNWKKYPAAMLRARAISAAMRAFCPDVLGSGVCTPEELEDVPREPAPIRVESSPAPRTSGGKRTLDDLAAPVTTDGEVIEARTADTHVAEVVAMIGNAQTPDDLEAARGVARETAKRVGFSRSQNAEIKRAIDARAEALSAVSVGEEVAS